MGQHKPIECRAWLQLDLAMFMQAASNRVLRQRNGLPSIAKKNRKEYKFMKRQSRVPHNMAITKKNIQQALKSVNKEELLQKFAFGVDCYKLPV